MIELAIVGVIIVMLFLFDYKRRRVERINKKYDDAITEEPTKADFYNIQRHHELKNKEEHKEHLRSYLKYQIDNFIVNRGKGNGTNKRAD